MSSFWIKKDDSNKRLNQNEWIFAFCYKDFRFVNPDRSAVTENAISIPNFFDSISTLKFSCARVCISDFKSFH